LDIRKILKLKKHVEHANFREFALDMISYLFIAKKSGLVELEDVLKKDMNDIVKILIVNLVNGIEKDQVEREMRDFVIHSRLTKDEATLILMFTNYFYNENISFDRVFEEVNKKFKLNFPIDESLLAKIAARVVKN
jgi:hypothetical protein